MTNTLAIVLAVLITTIIAADLLVFHWDLHIFLGRHMVALVEYLAFWR